MRKFLAILMTVAMLAALTISAAASFEPEEAFCEVKFNIGKQAVAWAADGTVTPGEYYEVAIDPTWLSFAVGDDANMDIAKNLNPQLFMSWDETYVYMATVYKPAEVWNEWDADPATMWVSGAIQINYANFDEVSSEYRLEYGVGRSTATGNMLYNVWADGCMSGYVPTEEDAVSFENDGVLTIETRCPWDAFADEDNTGKKIGNGFNMCLVWTQGTGTDTAASYIHTQLAEGCTGNGKHAEYFAQVTLDDVYEYEAAPAFGVQDASGSFDGEAADNLFDGDENTKWCFDSTAFTEPYVIWNVENALNVTGYEIVTANDNADYAGRNPGAWTLSGSADGENWTVIADVAEDKVLQDVNFTPFTFAADAAGEYSWFKYEIKNVVGGGVCQISGLNLLTGDVTPSEAPVEEVVEEAVEEAPAEEVEEVVEEAPVEEAEEVVEEAPQTFDFGVIALVSAVVSLAGYAVSKKH